MFLIHAYIHTISYFVSSTNCGMYWLRPCCVVFQLSSYTCAATVVQTKAVQQLCLGRVSNYCSDVICSSALVVVATNNYVTDKRCYCTHKCVQDVGCYRTQQAQRKTN